MLKEPAPKTVPALTGLIFESITLIARKLDLPD